MNFVWFSDSPKFMYPSMVPMEDETHSGEDVMVFARGPWAHLFTGNYEQNVIPLTMGFAAGVGPAARVAAGGPVAYSAATFPTVAFASLYAVLFGFALTQIFTARRIWTLRHGAMSWTRGQFYILRILFFIFF